MSYYYLYSRVGVLHFGYNFRLTLPMNYLKVSVAKFPADVSYQFCAFLEGEQIKTIEGVVSFEADGSTMAQSLSFEIDDIVKTPDKPGYYELHVAGANKQPVLSSKELNVSYGLYWKPGRKSFVAEVSDKFGDPRVVLQMARLGSFAQTYASVVLDKNLDYGESINVINPYSKAGVVHVYASGIGLLKKIRVDSLCAINIRLADFLLGDCDRWVGTIQLSGRNRFPYYTVKHKISDPSWITDHEHLDWFQPGTAAVPRANYYLDKVARFLIRIGLKKPRFAPE